MPSDPIRDPRSARIEDRLATLSARRAALKPEGDLHEPPVTPQVGYAAHWMSRYSRSVAEIQGGENRLRRHVKS